MAVIHFNGEVSPASTRGLLSGSMLFFNAWSNLWGAGMSRAYATETASKGWLIPIAVQFIPAVLFLIFIWVTVESPRWLIVKGRRDDALASLNRLRPKEDVAKGLTSVEIDAIVQSLEEQVGQDQGRWTNSFAATYYVTAGLKAHSFTCVFIGNALQIVSCAFQIGTYDWLGRRFFSIAGGTLTFLTIVATLGTGGSAAAPVSNTYSANTVIASIILTATFAHWSVTNAFVIGGEIGGTRHRRKLLAVGGVVNMLVAILITSVTPYLTNKAPGSVGLAARVGWFFAAASAFLALLGFFFVPELRGRSLEDTDELFDHCLWGWQFSKYQSVGIGAKIAAIQVSDSVRLRGASITSKKGGVHVVAGSEKSEV
ncbi:unnamed protein product [Zymoseptoria tritici ST99CH_1A5]|uniref:Major facilitator superfamily (MFS) profile domain-containing protein n=1 Tax=Zymoseptoria tritici ST99CH_1A5 TaxID=1276529 RepID=A0A1Y6L9Y4_ZYMTR|nr:unnamed protein product [Zymoseptoria tritici ST99CH_1A5]